ncbi:GNAT family N-acetyltransferase [Acetivibrio ethanolgignens]|uniref:N-acetyltransferase domain-containing protein n=1 Tax=Acetivibrio ethanolgignens TaxID=290052 RepID=A0A0V8QK20_9FIRM|nr:GNAT family N-acetyltransferase [Acetivibrio ethanolgignens]KSV60730.1 hypothetical protein ASU35_00750 [Acetivibrio ethanolgignens]
MRLETQNLVIRNIECKDKKRYFELYNSVFVQRYNCFTEKTVDEIEKYISSHIEDDNVLAVVSKDSEEFIGMIYLDEDSLRYMVDSIEISFWIDEKYSNKGYMTEGVGCLIDYLVDNNICKIISARAFVENCFSRKLLKKLNFEEEGILKRAIRNPQNKIFDDVLYAFFPKEIIR